MDFNLCFPEGSCAYHFTSAAVDAGALTKSEFNLVKDFAPSRIGDFARGRDCARRALARLGCHSAEILKGDHNEPLWPSGFSGSISHAKDITGAVVARSAGLKSLGLDIEHLGRVKPGMWDLLFSEAEKAFLLTLDSEQQDIYCTAFFSMKESFYKMQFPLTTTSLWFHDVEIRGKDEAFEITVIKEFEAKKELPELTPMHFIQSGSLIISSCYLEA